MKTNRVWAEMRQQSSEPAATTTVAKRGTPEMGSTLPRAALTREGKTTSRAKLKSSRDANSNWAMSALNTAKATTALSALPARGPAIEVTNALSGAELRKTSGCALAL